MTYKHSISSTGSDAAPGQVPEADVGAAPPPPVPAPPKVTADFAASAAMAKDILALDIEDGEAPPPPPHAQPSPLAAVADATKPRAVPDLDLPTGTTERSDSSPMAPDFFVSSSGNKSSRHRSSRSRSSKTKLFKLTR